jgi:hypothetical protein
VDGGRWTGFGCFGALLIIYFVEILDFRLRWVVPVFS